MEPNLYGAVVENDNEENIAIKTSSGDELILSYALIRSLLVQSEGSYTPIPTPTPVPTPATTSVPASSTPESNYHALYEQSPADILNQSDNQLKEVFSQLPKNDQKKLNSPFESFKYGIKMNDREKMGNAAKSARRILLSENEQGYDWSANASRFCGYLLRRANIYDPEVFLVCNNFFEAAYACWKNNDHTMAGVYAILALLDENPENVHDLFNILATGAYHSEDFSGLAVFYNHMPSSYASHMKTMVTELCSSKELKLAAPQDIHSAIAQLEKKYPKNEMETYLDGWFLRCEETSDRQNPTLDIIEANSSDNVPCEIYGSISRLNILENTGVICDESGNSYTFRIGDLTDTALSAAILSCCRSDLGGKTYYVKFFADGATARNIQFDNQLVDRARAICADTSRANRFEVAFEMCKKAVGSSDIHRALGDLPKHATALYKADPEKNLPYVQEAVDFYEKNRSFYPNKPFPLMNIALCYRYLKKYSDMLALAEKALTFDYLVVNQKIPILSGFLKSCRDYYEASGNKTLLTKMMAEIRAFEDSYQRDLSSDAQVQQLHRIHILPSLVYAECHLDMLEKAEVDYARLSNHHNEEIDALMDQTRARLDPAPEEDTFDESSENSPIFSADIEEKVQAESLEESSSENLEDTDDENGEELLDTSEEEELEEEIPPYVDHDGWDALKLTKADVIDYALTISGPDRIPSILAYLRAGSALNDQITPVYHTVALAANDPMECPDYNIAALSAALENSDPDYPILSDCCMAAAFLRTSFLSGRGYDYSAQGLRDSIAIAHQIPALRKTYDILETFRKESGRAIDIYADYRNHGVKKLMEDLDATVSYADELYTKFILTPARESVSFARILKTKEIVFDRSGYLATMLQHVINRDHDALETEKVNFVAHYLDSSNQFSANHINSTAVDEMIINCWELAGKELQTKKSSATLQGNRRNNLRSNISDILRTIAQWYALSEQSAGLTWRTLEGETAYQRLRPELLEQLAHLGSDCLTQMENSSDPEFSTGLFLLSATAKKLSARLDGTWTFEQEKFLYVDFLRNNHIILSDDFMPDLSSTFCVLPDFNVLARIRKHVEEEKLSFQDQIDRVYGPDKLCNNYGTADKIVEYLNAIGQQHTVVPRENSHQFIAQSELQTDMRYRSFCETYALAINYGQIIKSDVFCSTLEDTVKYWYFVCKKTKNFGFFNSIAIQAENQIHASAQQYERELEEQLEAFISTNRLYFSSNPEYAEAIRVQIANQNFTVAEDWLARIRIGDFSLEVQQPEAQKYLDHFWSEYVETYTKVFNAGRTLSSLLGRRSVHNKDTKGGQLLIDNWINSSTTSNPQRIEHLLNLLGWQNIHVKHYYPENARQGEFYEVTTEVHSSGLTTPSHPIAAFGSDLDKKAMYVVCLYGFYDCDRLFEKMQALDDIAGNKIILLDYALGQTDRRLIAQKIKKRHNVLRNVNIVIDRVLISHLADNYNATLISRILMALTMPFSYYQPYVVESSHTMPPEIFIGRQDELVDIEKPDGINLLYGGRQLGKSALFKKALSNIDGHQNQRAALIDINKKNCTEAALKVSKELVALQILPDTAITDNWDDLCQSIKDRLRSEEPPYIPYFLLMLDEADTFINDCANFEYGPMVALKDIQQSLPGRFKYVLAGLHNIIKFNQQVASGNNSVIPHITSKNVKPFMYPEAEELLIKPLSYLGFSLPSKATISQILSKCNYFPGLIQLYAKKLIESIRGADYGGFDSRKAPPYVISNELMRRVLCDKEFMEQIYRKLEITLKLGEDEGCRYYPLALFISMLYNLLPDKVASGYTAKDILYHAKDLSIHALSGLDLERIDAMLEELHDLNVLRSVSDNSYLLASKNFRDMLGTPDEILENLEAWKPTGGTAE